MWSWLSQSSFDYCFCVEIAWKKEGTSARVLRDFLVFNYRATFLILKNSPNDTKRLERIFIAFFLKQNFFHSNEISVESFFRHGSAAKKNNIKNRETFNFPTKKREYFLIFHCSLWIRERKYFCYGNFKRKIFCNFSLFSQRNDDNKGSSNSTNFSFCLKFNLFRKIFDEVHARED